MRNWGMYILIVLLGGACLLGTLAALLNSEAVSP